MNKVDFNDVFDSFKKLEVEEKKLAIIDFIRNNIVSLNKINSDIDNKLSTNDIDAIINIPIEDKLDAIFQMLHILTEQVELFSEKIANDFFE